MTLLNPSSYDLSSYDYVLPKHLIAKTPLPERDASRMLVLQQETQTLSDSYIANLPDCLEAGDLLVVNNAKVLPVRLLGHREGHSGQVECFLLTPEASEATGNLWHALLRPARKLPEGTQILIPLVAEAAAEAEKVSQNSEMSPTLRLNVVSRGEQGEGLVQLLLPQGLSLEETLKRFGHMPLPPYMQREEEASDKERYQTVYSKVPGAQAAPTAGLHFTPRLLERLQAKGIERVELTLLVGAGTFRGVASSDIRQHSMHGEAYEVSQEAIDAIRQCKARGGRVVAVGTTVLRTLETLAKNQNGLPTQAETGESKLFIYPGFQFEVVDLLLTNFHLPQSSLLMLVSAFAGLGFIQKAYQHAIEQQYRFYSYGDCMLLKP
jgi:S-adenosylmethionine:tRNA ribosyltransferase-isomerase